MGVLDRIGSLRERIRSRVGRPFGNCSGCGKPTRSHVVSGDTYCHACVDGGNVVMADGGHETGCGSRDHRHSHRLCLDDLTDDERAAILRRSIEDEIEAGSDPDRLRLLPKDGHDNKQLAHFRLGPGALDDDKIRFFEYTPEEAIEAVRNGHPGFAIYYGMERYGTEDVLAVDVDDRETFPYGEFPDTAKFISGSGGGDHLIYRNDGTVKNAVAKGDAEGEVRAWREYTVLPGSTHPSGGVYGIAEEREIATLSHNEIPEQLQPGDSWSGSTTDSETIELDPIEDSDHFTNQWGESLDEWRSRVERLDKLCRHLDLPRYDNDTSKADMAFASLLHKFGFDPSTIRSIFHRYRYRDKIARRDDYLPRTIQNACTGDRLDPPEERGNGGFEGEWDPGWATSIPLSRRAEAIATGWDWTTNAEPLIPRGEVYQRVERHIGDIMGYGQRALLDSPMSSGKTYSAFKVAAERGDPMTYLTARTDLYDQARDYSREHGLNAYVLPAVHRHCPTFQGEHGEDWAQRVHDHYDRGATPKAIHDNLGPPCCEAGCEYVARCDFEPDNFDVLIGNFAHANLPHVLAGRHVVVDEYPGDALREFLPGRELERTVNAFLDRFDFPADDYTALIEQRRDPEFVQRALSWFREFEWEPDVDGVFAYDDYHALTPHAIYTLVAGNAAGSANQGYPFEYARLPNGERHVGVFERGDEWDEKSVHLQVPPRNFHYARSVTCLDGTPNMDMWENAIGLRLTHRETFSSIEEKRSYYHDTLDIDVIRTSESVKPYSKANDGEWVTTDKDRNIAGGIADEVKEPVVVSTKTAIEEYEEDGWDEPDGPAAALDNFANLRGSNRYAREECALIVGSTNYGHRWVQREAAFQNEAVFPEGHGNDQDYGDADEIARQMKEAVILQTILRFGRDAGTGAVVYLHTNVVPDEIEIEGVGWAEWTPTQNQRDIFNACASLADYQDEITPGDVIEHPDVDCSRRTVQRTMRIFCEKGAFAAKDQDGRRVVYSGWDERPHRLTADGEITIPEVETDRDEEHNVVFVPLFGVDPPERPPTTPTGETDAEPPPIPGGNAAPDGPPAG